MWFHNSKETLNSKESIFLRLFEECKSCRPNANLTIKLRNKLEVLPRNMRREIASLSKDGCTPLFMACKKGNVSVVEYLITVCDVDIEQRGIYELESSNDHCVTPLWCAAVSGNLPVTMCLIKHGADINAVSDTGSTPVRSACFLTHLDIVAYLVEHGADIQKGNHNGVTCLINSVQSVKLCSYLLQHGAAINAKDLQDKTALHYAVQECRLETTKLLLSRGADPYAKSKRNDDALRLACLKGSVEIFDCLITSVSYPPERLAEAHELLGSTFLDDFNDVEAAVHYWSIATAIRHQSTPPLEKLPVLVPRREFKFSREFRTEEQLRRISSDLDELWTQSLIICERILGPDHKNFVSKLMYRGAAYADAFKYQKCIDLWKRNLEIRVQKDSILFSDTCLTSQCLVQLYVDFKCSSLMKSRKMSNLKDVPKFEDLTETFKLLVDELPKSQKQLQIRPVFKKQQENFDRILICITHLIFLLTETSKTKEEKALVRTLVTKLVRINPRSAFHGDTLLHLCLSRLNTIKTSNCQLQVMYPNLNVIRLLLDCGALINATNQCHSTPLHIASNTYNYSAPVVKLLLKNGAHIDQPNSKAETPKSLLIQNHRKLCLLKYLTLKCLAATALVHYNINYKGCVPETLEAFVSFHKP